MAEPSNTQIRNTIRQTFRERRRRLSNTEQEMAADALLDIVNQHHVLQPNMNIALYKTNDSELSTEPMIEYCWQNDINVYLPILHPFSEGNLLFLKYTTKSAMMPNLYGIPEPRLDITAVCPISELDVIFTPLVAFDIDGNRIGMGGGFYDRTLASVEKNGIDTKVIGIAHDIQRTLSLPVESWDIPLPAIATPSQFYSFTK